MSHESALGRRLANIASAARRSSQVRASAGVGVLAGAEVVLGLLTAVLLARSLGPEGLGIYSLALAAAVLVTLPVGFGLPRLVMREIAHLTRDSDHGVAKGIVFFAGAVILLMSCVIVPLVLVFGGLLVPGLDEAEQLLIPLVALLIPVTAISNTLSGALAGRQRVVIGAMAQSLVRPGLFAVAVTGAMLISPGWLTPVGAMALQFVAAGGGLAFATFCFLREFAPTLRRPGVQILWRAWAAATLRFGLTAGLRLGQGQILVLLTGALSSAEHVGLLRIAQRGAGLVAFGTGIAATVAAPRYARMSAKGQRELLQRLILRVARGSSAIALTVFAGYLAIAHWLLESLFGSEFVAAWSALMILSGAEVVRALFGPGAALMSMLRHEGVTVLSLFLSFAASIIFAATLIPSFGVDGTAWGMLFGVTLMSLFLMREARRRLALDPTVLGQSIAPRTRKEIN